MVDVKGLDEVRAASGQRVEDIGGKSAADVALRDGYKRQVLACRGKAGSQTDLAEKHGVNIVKHQQVGSGGKGYALHGVGGAHRSVELFHIDIRIYLVRRGKLVGYFPHGLVRCAVYFVYQLRDRKKMYFGTYLHEYIVGIKICRPHCLVVAGKQGYA